MKKRVLCRGVGLCDGPLPGGLRRCGGGGPRRPRRQRPRQRLRRRRRLPRRLRPRMHPRRRRQRAEPLSSASTRISRLWALSEMTGNLPGFDLELAAEVASRLGPGVCAAAHCLGRQGYGAGCGKILNCIWKWLYHDRPGGGLHLDRALHGEHAGLCGSCGFRHRQPGGSGRQGGGVPGGFLR